MLIRPALVCPGGKVCEISRFPAFASGSSSKLNSIPTLWHLETPKLLRALERLEGFHWTGTIKDNSFSFPRFHSFLLFMGYSPYTIREVNINKFCKIISEFALEYRTTRERVLQQKQKRANHRERNKTRGKMITDVSREFSHSPWHCENICHWPVTSHLFWSLPTLTPPAWDLHVAHGHCRHCSSPDRLLWAFVSLC